MIAKATDGLDTEGSGVALACPLEPGILTTYTSEPTLATYVPKDRKCVCRKSAWHCSLWEHGKNMAYPCIPGSLKHLCMYILNENK